MRGAHLCNEGARLTMPSCLSCRGQTPHWLDWTLVDRPWAPAELDDRACAVAEQALDGTSYAAHVEASSGRRALSWSFHSEVFQGDAAWKADALPTFNSCVRPATMSLASGD
jgi:hypothetical protein